MKPAPYTLRLESRADTDADVFTFGTADGVLSKDEFRTTELLLLETVEPAPGDRALVVDANYGLVGVVLAAMNPGGHTVLAETSARAADLCERNLVANDRTNAAVELTADVADCVTRPFDLAAFAPKPYDPTDVVQQRIADALAALHPDAPLYVSARTNEGGKRYRRTLRDLAGDVETVLKHGNARVYRAIRPADFDPPRFVEEHRFEATARGATCTFETRSGLFSATGLDDGTRLLLEHLPDPDGGRVLDLACGYGAVGTFLGRTADCRLWLTDDDRVATSYAARNLDRNGVAAEAVVTADCLDGVGNQRFDLVASNPPTHAGAGVTSQLFRQAHEALAPGGRLVVVYNETLGYESELDGLFASTEVLADEDGYLVTAATK